MTATIDPFECSLDPPLKTARETMKTRAGLLFRVEDGPGGIGDSAPLLPFTEAYRESKRVLEDAAKAFQQSRWRGAFRVVSETENGILRYPAARHAVSLARLDWLGRRLGNPIHAILGSQNMGPVAVNATVGDRSPEQTATDATRAIEAGFPAIKIKVGVGSVSRDIDRIRAVRSQIGPKPAVRVDANGAWDQRTARAFLKKTQDLNLSLLEQPLPVQQTAAHEELRDFGTDILLDESLAHESIESLLDADVADGFVLKPMALGGVDRARGVALRAMKQGASVVITSIFESVVGRTGAIHLAASLDELPPSGLATADRFASDLGPDPAPVQNGSIVPPSKPGLGIEEVQTNG